MYIYSYEKVVERSSADAEGDDENKPAKDNGIWDGDEENSGHVDAGDEEADANANRKRPGKRSRDLEVLFAESRETWASVKSPPAKDLFDICRGLVAMRNSYRTTQQQHKHMVSVCERVSILSLPVVRKHRNL
jgi:hypothetical protein